jgi:hypothetical protein
MRNSARFTLSVCNKFNKHSKQQLWLIKWQNLCVSYKTDFTACFFVQLAQSAANAPKTSRTTKQAFI